MHGWSFDASEEQVSLATASSSSQQSASPVHRCDRQSNLSPSVFQFPCKIEEMSDVKVPSFPFTTSEKKPADSDSNWQKELIDWIPSTRYRLELYTWYHIIMSIPTPGELKKRSSTLMPKGCAKIGTMHFLGRIYFVTFLIAAKKLRTRTAASPLCGTTYIKRTV